MVDNSPAHDNGSPRQVWIVPHTHWDREWYEPAQTYRLKLVDLVDSLLDELEQQPAYAHFMLDGQMAVVDDYLEVRPDAAGRIRRLAASGRLGVGPWYVLMDEFLVSGETIIRNLQLGLDRAAGFGGAMEVGYLPDMFGHIAQMPQILQGFGMEHAVVWRGVPAAIDRSAFWWEAPNGSVVRAEYLPDGYGNGAATPDDAKELIGRIEQFERHWGDLLGGPILWMNGTDHELPQPWLGRVVAEANDLSGRYRLQMGSLAEYLTHAPTEDLATWTGELRSGARANLLMGVASNRVDVKQHAAAAERWLERVAEPASALWLTPSEWPGAQLDIAWRQVVLNSAHDSSCACSHDDVCTAVNVRYAEARHIGEGLAAKAADALARRLATAGTVAINPSAVSRPAVIEVDLPGHTPVPNTQLLKLFGGPKRTERLPLGTAAEVTRMMLAWERHLTHVELTVIDDTVEIRPLDTAAADTARIAEADLPPSAVRHILDVDTAVAELARLAADPGAVLDAVVINEEPFSHRALAFVSDLPGFGWARIDGSDIPDHPVEAHATPNGGAHITNEMVTVAVDPTDGTFSLNGTPGLGRLVDDGDVGDTYNWCPPADDTVVDQPVSVTVTVTETGPLRAVVRIDRTYRWPVTADTARRSSDTAEVAVTTMLKLDADSPLVGIEVSLVNPATDHRLRMVMPLPERATHSDAECAFATVRRPLWAEGGPTEMPVPTRPMRRFVCAGGLTAVTDGLLEYELVDIDPVGGPTQPDATAGALAITLLRCTGLISRGPMVTRPLPAGPPTPTPHAQMPGRQTLRLAVAADGNPVEGFVLAARAFDPVLTSPAGGGGTLGDRGSALVVSGAQVSSLRRRDTVTELRVFNPSPESVVATVEGHSGWVVDLRGRTIAPFEGSVDLGPWEIATLRLTNPEATSGPR